MGTAFDRTTLLFVVLVAAVAAFHFHKSGQLPAESAGRALRLFLNILPKIALGFLFGVWLADALPREIIENWLSASSGWRGIFIGWVVGSMMPMGAPFVTFPLAAGLLKGGAGLGSVISLVTAASLLGPPRIIAYELPIMGAGFFFLRFLGVFWFPPVAGALVQWIAGRFH